MLTALLLGISYGFAAGISPGPTFALTISQTIQRGWRAGNLVALAPLVTDAPIILAATLLIRRLPASTFGWMELLGGLFVVYLGFETLRSVRAGAGSADQAGGQAGAEQPLRSVFWRAVVTNALNPHPYLFWGAVGGQLLLGSFRDEGFGGAVGFLVGFYALLVGLKVALALTVNHSRRWLQGRAYRGLLGASGLLLAGLGLLLVSSGLGALI